MWINYCAAYARWGCWETIQEIHLSFAGASCNNGGWIITVVCWTPGWLPFYIERMVLVLLCRFRLYLLLNWFHTLPFWIFSYNYCCTGRTVQFTDAYFNNSNCARCFEFGLQFSTNAGLDISGFTLGWICIALSTTAVLLTSSVVGLILTVIISLFRGDNFGFECFLNIMSISICHWCILVSIRMLLLYFSGWDFNVIFWVFVWR